MPHVPPLLGARVDTPAERRVLADFYRDALLQDTVAFWLAHGFDQEQGGILTCLDCDGSHVDTDKGIWQQGRFAWLMGQLYNTVDRRPEWLAACQSTVEFLERYGFDSDGRMWFHVTRDGQPLRRRRYAFSEVFAAIAFGEFARATGSERHRELAIQTFRTYLDVHTRPGGMTPKFTGIRPTKGLATPMIALVTAQELRESLAWPEANAIIDAAIAEIKRDFCHEELECVLETVGPAGEFYDHFEGRTINPGHAIEGAWFILREADHRNDRRLAELGCRMLDWTWRRGWDEEYGGLFYFRDVLGKPVQEYWHDMKFWWPHNEALLASLWAWHLTGESRYAEMHQQVHDWAHQHFADPEHGEWFGYLHRDGRLSVSLKGNLWKGCFHLPRMQLVAWQLLKRHTPAE